MLYCKRLCLCVIKSLLFIASAFCVPLVVSCTPKGYEINSTANSGDSKYSNQEGESDSLIPESQKDGYMRIVGDLRWDQLTSPSEWKERIKCLKNDDGKGPNEIQNLQYESCPYDIGGLKMGPYRVGFGKSSGTSSGKMTQRIFFVFANEADKRAFDALIQQKYDVFTDEKSNKLFCSEYTCWDVGKYPTTLPIAIAYPSPHSLSILDGKKVDASEF